jgi:putative intracellular protease/amidase
MRKLSLILLLAIFGMLSAVGMADQAKVKRILFVMTSHGQKGDTGKPTGYYLAEVAHPYHVLNERGYSIDFVSPKGGEPPVDGMDLKDPVNKAFWEDPAIQKRLKSTLKPDEVKASDYAAIFYAGGHGTMWDFPDQQKLAELASDIYEAGGLVAAVCHGPAALVNIKLKDGSYLVKDHDLTGFTNEEEEAVGLTKVVPFLLEDRLRERGGRFHGVAKFEANTVVSGRLITGQNPASATGVGTAIADTLENI